GGLHTQRGIRRGAGGSDLAVEPLTGAGGSSWYPRFGTRLLSGSTSPGAGETAGQGLFIVTDCGMLGSWRRARGAGSDWRWPAAAARPATAQPAAASPPTGLAACRVS